MGFSAELTATMIGAHALVGYKVGLIVLVVAGINKVSELENAICCLYLFLLCDGMVLRGKYRR